jgi:GNAT superfamily N-acetyltransferase
MVKYWIIRRRKMNDQFKPCKQEDIKDLIQDYVSMLQSPFDAFLEEHILNSTFYLIEKTGETIGYCAIFKEDLLTQFYLRKSMYSKSQEVFTQVLASHPISSIFVPTSDEFFLSTVLDQDFKLTKQAYFFQDSQIPVPEERLFASGFFRKAEQSDVNLIIAISQDFFDRLGERIEDGEIFVFMKGNHLLGVGIIEKSKMQQGFASVGMFVNEEFRQQGIGRSIIYHLKEWCYQNQLRPICGCWYYNIHSKLTLESAGMVSKTRLLNFQVVKS